MEDHTPEKGGALFVDVVKEDDFFSTRQIDLVFALVEEFTESWNEKSQDGQIKYLICSKS